MGRFARDAPWIRAIFPPSSTPQTQQPSAVSEDIQLTQDYLAYGQTQRSSLWLSEFIATNPGPGGPLTFLSAAGPGLPGGIPSALIELWRVFFITIRIPLGPAANFDYIVGINVPQLASTIELDGESIAATQTFGNQVEIPSDQPLLLPARPQGQGGFASLLLNQTSGQAAGLETLEIFCWFLRNPVGVAHVI